MSVGTQSQTRAIGSGELKGKYVLVNDTSSGTSGIGVFNSDYQPGGKITETGLLSVGGSNFQITSSLGSGQDVANVDVQAFLKTQLYTDTLNILNSFSASN